MMTISYMDTLKNNRKRLCDEKFSTTTLLLVITQIYDGEWFLFNMEPLTG